ncbi:MAG: phosphoribosyltransferase family protein, partial [Vicinamibacterales bacterium]
LAVGAIDEDGTVLEGPHFRGVPEPYLREEIRVQQKILRDRRERYTRQRPAVPLEGRLVVIVDDGVATGASMLAAVRAVRARKPAGLVVAIGVAPPASVRALEAEADEVVCLYAPTYFEAVGQFYDDFSEVTDEMVVAALAPPPGSAVRP